MSLDVRITRQAQKDLETLSPIMRRRVAQTIEDWAADGRGDILKLQGHEGMYRLRVGDVRVLIVRGPEAHTVTIVRVLPRGDAYKRR